MLAACGAAADVIDKNGAFIIRTFKRFTSSKDPKFKSLEKK